MICPLKPEGASTSAKGYSARIFNLDKPSFSTVILKVRDTLVYRQQAAKNILLRYKTVVQKGGLVADTIVTQDVTAPTSL